VKQAGSKSRAADDLESAQQLWASKLLTRWGKALMKLTTF
jgi:hypothetical protein